MAEPFEVRHRELRDNAPFEIEHEFNVRTGQLVDEQVAVHRRLVRLLESAVSDPSVRISGVDLVLFGLRLSRAVSDSEVALAALDEEAARD